jgi:hypothetical protein
MPTCMICRRPLSLESYGHDSPHMLPPQTPEQARTLLEVQREWTPVAERELDPISRLTKGRKKGIAARDGKPQRLLF